MPQHLTKKKVDFQGLELRLFDLKRCKLYRPALAKTILNICSLLIFPPFTNVIRDKLKNEFTEDQNIDVLLYSDRHIIKLLIDYLAVQMISPYPMRKSRILGERETNYYHVMSRVVNRDFIFGDEEKEFFRTSMRKLEGFTGLRVLTYCIMSNHWHILVEVPSVEKLPDEELHRRIRSFYPKLRATIILQEYERVLTYSTQIGNTAQLDKWREKYTSRMGDLSIFVKELKERFSKWYNRKHNRRGTLWEERFKSVLVEGSDYAIATMATYIELNPVRAGLVEDPRNYRFCGYAEAVAGGVAARSGIEQILFLYGQHASWRKIAAQYRINLFSTGEETDGRKGFDPEKVQAVIENRGELSSFELMRCRIRYFNDGVALGSKLFIEEVFEQNRTLFSERRKNGARKIRGSTLTDLFNLRDLRREAVTPSRLAGTG